MNADAQSPDGSDNPYYAFQARKLLIVAVLAVFCFVIAVYSMTNGAYYISFLDVIKVLLGGGDTTQHVVIWNIRLPMVLAGVFIGCALSIAGVVMQCVLKNPLASPYTLGISNAASFGAAIAIAGSSLFAGTFLEGVLDSVYGTSVMAFVMSMVAVAVVMAFSRSSMSSPEGMVLAGVALGSIFSAGLSSLQYFVTDSQLSDIVFWQFGDLSKAEWLDLGVIAALLLPILIYFVYHRMDFNAMAAGEEVAQSLGINTKRLTYMVMILSSALAAICISVVGIIGFVGLLGPHIMRRIVGNDHRFLIPASMVMGIFVLLLSDAIGRLAFGTVLPVGIITSFFGGPLFLYILISRRRRRRCRST